MKVKLIESDNHRYYGIETIDFSTTFTIREGGISGKELNAAGAKSRRFYNHLPYYFLASEYEEVID